MHHVLVKDNKVAHVWKGPIPRGIENTFPVAPGSAHVGDEWDAVSNTAIPKAPQITIDEVNAECERRILELFPFARQLNILDEGSQAELQEFKDRRNALRSCARALILMSPIPVNYRDDRFWAGTPWQSNGYAGGYGMQGAQSQHALPMQAGMLLPGYGGAHTNQPIIMMQAPVPPPAPAPIIINGASPGTTVIQGPAQVQQPQAPQVNLITPPSLPVAQSAPPAQQMRSTGLPAPSNTVAPQAVPSIDEDEIIYETAARALTGQESAIAYMAEIAKARDTEWQPLCEALLTERFERFDKVLKKAAGG